MLKKLLVLSFLLIVPSLSFGTDYTFFRGDDNTFSLTFTDSSDNPIDITGWIIFFTLKTTKSDTDANALITKDVTLHDDATNGQTSFTLLHTETNSILEATYYDIQYKDDSDNVKTVDSGKMVFSQDITIRIE